jgi:hypothetical protein
MSQASTSSQPPPAAAPSTAAIHGLCRGALTKPAKPKVGWIFEGAPPLTFEVSPRAEDPFGAGRENGDPNLFVGICGSSGRSQRLGQLTVHGIARKRPIQLRNQNMPVWPRKQNGWLHRG